MVCARVSEERRRLTQSMEIEPEKSKALHNFTLPCLRWGNQRQLRCKKLNSGEGEVLSGADRRVPTSRLEKFLDTSRRERISELPVFFKDSKSSIGRTKLDKYDGGCGGEDGIEAVRERLMFDLKTAADKMKDAMFLKDVVETEEEEVENDKATVAAAEVRRWNLRKRSKISHVEEKNVGNQNNSPAKSDGGRGKLPRMKSEPEKEKFSVSLSKKEIEQDFMDLLGRRPPRRPKKRPRVVQNQLDILFPGLWLTEITADCYKVPESK